MPPASALETLVRRDRLVVLAGLGGLAVVAWTYVVYLARGMASPGMAAGMDMAMPQVQPWGWVGFSLAFVMWAVMMAAMMVPTATPMILMFAGINRKRRQAQRPFVPTSVFLAGYLAVWSLFAGLAALTQGALSAAALLSPMLAANSPFLGGGLLLGAGAFQWSPLKRRCLVHCRTPLGFIMSEWRDGSRGALRMGFKHGLYCVGCCWVLMGLLFALGVMNLLWIAGLAAFVLVEKVLPGGDHLWVSRGSGLLMAGWGAWMVVMALA